VCDVSSVKAQFPGLVVAEGPTAYLYSEGADGTCSTAGSPSTMILAIDLGRQDGVDVRSDPMACPTAPCFILAAPDITGEQTAEVAISWDTGTDETPIRFVGLFFDPELGGKAFIEAMGPETPFRTGGTDDRRMVVTCESVAHGDPPVVIQLTATRDVGAQGVWTLERRPWAIDGSTMTAGPASETRVNEAAIPAQGTLCGAPFGSLPPNGEISAG
jgi:hypothetical protein